MPAQFVFCIAESLRCSLQVVQLGRHPSGDNKKLENCRCCRHNPLRRISSQWDYPGIEYIQSS